MRPEIAPATGSRTEAVLDHAHSAVVSLDESGVVTYWNPSAERMFGIPADGALGRPVAGLIIPERFRAAHARGIRRFLAEGVGPMFDRRVELAATRGDGSEFPIEMTVTALLEPAGWSFTAFIADVSERVAGEREREELLKRLREALSESQLRFDAIVGSLTDAVTIRSHDHRLLYANPAALSYLGFDSLEQLRASSPAEIMASYRVFSEDGREVSMADIPSVRILGGQTAEPLIIRTVHRVTGVERWNFLKAAPLSSENGTLATIMLIEDVTEQKRAERHAAFLARASDLLASSLDYELTLRNVADLAVPDIVDWCAVDLLGANGEHQTVTVAHSDPERLRLAEELGRYQPSRLDPNEGLGLVLRTGETQFYPEIPEELLVGVAVDERHLELIRSVGMRSAAIVPMRLGNRILGALTLVSADSGRVMDHTDVALAQQLAARATTAIENARLYSQRTQIAHTLQQSLLPQRLPEISGYELASAYMPAVSGAEVGGDFYDVWPHSSGWMAAIGDVTGKGVEAATRTSLARHTLRTASAFLNSPAELLAHLDQALKSQPEPSFCTAICLQLNPRSGEITIAIGGHPPPALISSNGDLRTIGTPGPLLGALSNACWTDAVVKLEPDATLLLYTDGVTDTVGEGRERFGPDRLEQQLQAHKPTAASLIDDLTAALRRFQVGDQADDTAMLALRRKA